MNIQSIDISNLKYILIGVYGLRRILRVIIFFPIFLLFNSCIEEKIEPPLFGGIHGTIVSKLTNQAIKDVEITTVPVTNVMFTNESGEFLIEGLPPGEYTVITKVENYSRESVKVKVENDLVTELNIRLSYSTVLAPEPETPIPIDEAKDQPLAITLQWSIDRFSEDTFHYRVRLYEADKIIPRIEVEEIYDTLLLIENLEYNTTYFWQVTAISSDGFENAGNIWKFKTIPFPDNNLVYASNSSGNYEIYSSALNGDSTVRLTNNSSYELKPLLNNDRSLIAFSSNKNIDYQLYLMNSDGTGIHRITSLSVAGFHNQGIGFSWSHNYEKLIYSHYEKLYRINKEGVGLKLIATAPQNRNFRSCDWTSVNNKIIVETIGSYIYDSEIYLMDDDGSDTIRIVDNLPGIIESPSFSIDGNQIMYTRDVSGYESENGRQLDSRIFIKNISTMVVNEISIGKKDGTNDLQPRFSPDGAKIIFINKSNDGSGKSVIYIMDKNGSNRKKLIEDALMPCLQ